MAFLKRGLVFLALLAACAPQAVPTADVQVLRVGTSPAAEAWLDAFYTCAADLPNVALMRVPPDDADIRLQIGEPDFVIGAAWQVGTAVLTVAFNAANPLESLRAEDVRGLFRGNADNWSVLGGADAAVALWLFPPESDVTRAFRVRWLDGAPVFPSARWAANPSVLAGELEADPGAVGVLPLDALSTGLRAAARWDEPVLALTASEPSESVLTLIACVQSQSQKR